MYCMRLFNKFLDRSISNKRTIKQCHHNFPFNYNTVEDLSDNNANMVEDLSNNNNEAK